MRILITALILCLAGLQYRLWFGEGSASELAELERNIAQQQVENDRLQQKNRALAAQVLALKNDPQAIESRAREDLGMIKRGETFYMLLPAE